MAHDARCSGSVLTPVRDCGCQCDKALHGVPHSDRGSAFFAPAEGRVERAGRVSTKFRTRLNADPDADRWSERASDYIGAKLTEEAIVVGFEPAGVLNAISETALDALFDAVRDGTVTSSEAERIDAVFQSGHLFCALCVAILKAVEIVAEGRDLLRDEAIQRMLDLAFPRSQFTAVMRGVVRGALRAAFDAGVKALSGATQLEAAVKSVRFFAVLSCPDVDRHPEDEVNEYCLQPLAVEFLAPWLQKWLKAWSPVPILVQVP